MGDVFDKLGMIVDDDQCVHPFTQAQRIDSCFADSI